MDKELRAAAMSGNHRQLARILKLNNRSYDINCVDSDGRTPLFLAAREGKEEAVQMLLNAGSDVSLRCKKNGDTPLIIACCDGHFKVVSMLLAAGSDVNGPNYNGWTPLIYAAYYNHQEVVRVLIEHNADLNLTSQAGCTALYRASLDGRLESARLLIEAGADINLANSSGNTPLSVAARNGHTDIVKLLLEAGALVNTVDADGLTPLHEALDYDKDEITELLVTLGKADTSLPDPTGRRPVSMAKSDKIARLIENVEQTRRITESLAELQVSQPQLTQLTQSTQKATENDTHNDTFTAETAVTTSETTLTAAGDAPLTPNSGMTAISTAALSRLTSLAEASPLTIECLKQFGASVVQAERDYDIIRRDPCIYEYYLFFIQAVSSAVLACQSIASGMIDDSRVSSAENFMEYVDSAAQAVSWMGAPIVTGIGKILVRIPNVMYRQRTVRRITTFFPSIDSHKYIEILSREMTIFLARDIHAIMREAKRAPKQSILDRVMKVVEWLDTATNLSVVQGLACGHAALLVEKMMEEERPFPVQLENINMLMQWATEKEMKEIEDRDNSRPGTPFSGPISSRSPAATVAAEVADASNDPVPSDTDAAAAVSVAEQKEIDERIQKLEQRLSMERQQRTALEQKQASELNALKKQMKGLEAVNHIFSGMNAAGGLMDAQSAESMHKTIEDHLRGQAVQQTQQGEILRELTLRVELLVEDNQLHYPVVIEVPGSSQGSLVYSQKSAPMGEWVNSKMSYTADGASPVSTSPVGSVFPATPGSTSSAGKSKENPQNTSHKSNTSPISSKSNRTSKARSTDWTKTDIETDAAGFIVDTPGCCVLS